MRVRQRQLLYGTAFGVAGFLVGCLITHLVTPAGFLEDMPRWKVTVWVFLSAHFVPISGLQVGGLSAAFTRVDLVSQVPALQTLRVVPVLLTALGGLLVVEAVNYTTRLKHLIQNSGALLMGYLSTGILLFVVSEAQPGVSILLVLAAVLGGCAYLGGVVTQRITGGVPVFAVTSVGGIVAIGLLVVLGGVVVLQAIAPLIGVSVVGVLAGALLAWIARNVPS